MEMSSYVIICRSLIFIYGTEYVCEDMWQRGQTANYILKHNAQKQDADTMQGMSVLYMT